MMADTQMALAATVRRMLFGQALAQALYVAAELGIADLLAVGPLPVEALAGATGAHAPALARVLRLLAGEGVFEERVPGRFALTPAAATLRRDAPGSVWAQARFFGGEAGWRAWGNLLHSVRTGEPAFDHTWGMGLFAYGAQHPDAGAVFNQFMVAQTTLQAAAVVAAYDLAGVTTVVDVGGGRGALLAALLAAHPHLRGVLFDQPTVVADAGPVLRAAGVAGRCAVESGDFFAAVPAGGDAYVLKNILHDWDDERATAILAACRRAATAATRLLVVEAVLLPGNAPGLGKFLDVTMLALTGGQERTEAEFRGLFAAAGFALVRIVPTEAGLCVLEGRPLETG